MGRITRKELLQHLSRFHACSDSAAWMDETRGQPAALWLACARGDWMLWLAARAGVDRRSVVLAACACARLALRRIPAGEERPRKAIETAEAWARGKATLMEVRKAANAAADADAYASADAAYAAADAADDAGAAYASAAVNAYASGVGVAAREKTLAKCAAIVRARIKWSDIARALAGEGAP